MQSKVKFKPSLSAAATPTSKKKKCDEFKDDDNHTLTLCF
jgi:hypothetical protein